MTAIAPTQNVVKATTVAAAISTASRNVNLGVERRASDAADTLVNDIAILAIELVKVS